MKPTQINWNAEAERQYRARKPWLKKRAAIKN